MARIIVWSTPTSTSDGSTWTEDLHAQDAANDATTAGPANGVWYDEPAPMDPDILDQILQYQPDVHDARILFDFPTVNFWDFLRGLYRTPRAELLRLQQKTPSICNAKYKKNRAITRVRRMMFCCSGYLPARVRRIRKST